MPILASFKTLTISTSINSFCFIDVLTFFSVGSDGLVEVAEEEEKVGISVLGLFSKLPIR